MKFCLLALAATLAVASAVDCDVTKVAPLLSDPNIATCTADSGFSFTALSAPTAETLPKLCASTACKTVLGAVKGLGLGDCTLLGMKLESELITPIQTACAKSSTAAGSSAGSAASAATVTTTAPAAATPMPVGMTMGSSASSSSAASSETVSTPSASKTPTPTTSSASAVTVATSAAVVAVAAAFL